MNVAALTAAQEVFRPDLFAAAVGGASRGQKAPKDVGAFAGPIFEPSQIEAYLAAFPGHGKSGSNI